MCDYVSCRQSEYARHISTRKHLNNLARCEKSPETIAFITPINAHQNANIINHTHSISAPKCAKDTKITKKVSRASKVYQCSLCDKKYVGAYGLERHRRAAHEDSKIISLAHTDETVRRLCKRNDELYQTIIDISKKLQPPAITTNSNNVNTNSHNKTFNLNFFLNETCKDAMNISEFIKTIQVSLGELERVGEIGFVKGISDIITKKLNGLALTKRPIHCSDLKRETLYVKDEDEWAKEAVGNPRITNLIQHVSHKNLGTLGAWREEHPDYGNPAAHESNQYQSLIAAACNGGGDSNLSNESIARRVAKHVVIGKGNSDV